METMTSLPICEPEPGNLVPMLAVAAVFLLGGWLFGRWKKKRGSGPRKP